MGEMVSAPWARVVGRLVRPDGSPLSATVALAPAVTPAAVVIDGKGAVMGGGVAARTGPAGEVDFRLLVGEVREWRLSVVGGGIVVLARRVTLAPGGTFSLPDLLGLDAGFVLPPPSPVEGVIDLGDGTVSVPAMSGDGLTFEADGVTDGVTVEIGADE